MPIDFNAERWDRIKRTYAAWWDGTLDRPVVAMRRYGRDPGRAKPKAALLSQSNCMGLGVPAGEIINRIDYELSRVAYFGDDFPYFNMDCFGPGVAAAFCGAKMDNSSGGVWFFPEKIMPIEELHFEYDPGNVWLNRIKEICREGMRRWQGQVLMGMADLGGILDILSSFRTAENLLMDLYDHPEEVTRLVWELHGLWHRFYDEINESLQPVNPGYSDFSGVYSSVPGYILQSDFSYMISPMMFDAFVKPELEASCKKLPHTIYHLDGVGQLAHLDSLLEIGELDGVQWVPGDGMPGQRHWPDIYRKIVRAGKRTYLWEGADALDAVICQTGTRKGLLLRTAAGPEAGEADIKRMLAKYGAE